MNENATVELLMDDQDRNGTPVLKGERGVVKSVSRDFLIVDFGAGRLAEVPETLLSPIYTPEQTATFGESER